LTQWAIQLFIPRIETRGVQEGAPADIVPDTGSTGPRRDQRDAQIGALDLLAVEHAGIENFNAWLDDWLARANRRTHRGAVVPTADRFAEDASEPRPRGAECP
jgi:hypothetical protein